MKSILVIFHCESNTRYAIESLESVFFEMALELTGGDPARVHFGYPGMDRGPSSSLPNWFTQYLIVNSADARTASVKRVVSYIENFQIDTIFGFDQPVSFPLYKHFRAAGVRTFVSYWGAPMSSVFGPVKLALKRFEVLLRKNGPDHYVFESRGMARTAVYGRGISTKKTSVIPLGVNTSTYFPDARDSQYVFEQFSIPKHRRIFVFSGHMERRKGVHIILRAAIALLEKMLRTDWHVLLFGNPGPDKARLEAELGSSSARRHVTFGGYRDDLPRIHRGCYAGIVASTGWDSLTMSALEMQSSGLPLLTSDLSGLNEAIEHGQTGLLFKVGDHDELAATMAQLLDDSTLRDRLSMGARRRAQREFSREVQISRLTSLMRKLDRGSTS